MSKSPSPYSVRRRVAYLRSLQLHVESLHKRLNDAVRHLELKYQARRNAVSERRRRLVTGVVEPDDDSADDEDYVRGVPDFWLTALRNAPPPLQGMVRPRDEPALRCLLDVQVTPCAAPEGFELRFLFAPNDLFTNAVLTKRYVTAPGTHPATGCTIYWRRDVAKRGPSFFDFFSPPETPIGFADRAAYRRLRRDLERGLFFRDAFLRDAVSYFCAPPPPPPPRATSPPTAHVLGAGELVVSALDGRLR